MCGSATVMVQASDPDAELSSLRGRGRGGTRRAGATRGRSDRAGRPGPAGHRPVPLRRARSRGGGRAGRLPARRGGGAAHRGPLTAAVVGFSPGFAYLEGLPSPLDRVPRRPRPRPVVPAGSVAIANGHAAVYPTASPGGWHLVGRTGFPLFSAQAPPYAVLAPGDRVRFTVAGAGERVEPEPVVAPPWSLPPDARAVFEVVAPGCGPSCRTVGAGRSPRSVSPAPGPADPVSFDLANRLAGNAARSGRARAHGGRDPAALPRRVPRGRGGRRARGPRRRHAGPGRTAAAPGRGPGARGRPPARRMPQLRVGGRRVPRAASGSGAAPATN